MKHVLLSFLTTILIVAMTLSAMVILVRATLYVTAIESPLQRAGAIGGGTSCWAWCCCWEQSGWRRIWLC